MRLRVTTVLFLIVAGVQASSGDTTDDVVEEALKDCDKNQLTLNFCARHDFDVVNADLNRLFKELMSRLTTETTRQQLLDAQRAWIAFRDKDCIYDASYVDGGSAYPLVKFKCLKVRTQQRVNELREFLSCYDEYGEECPR